MTKPSAVLVEGARGFGGRGVVVRGHRPHRIEQHGQRPIELLAAAGEHDVLLAVLDHLVGIADAMVGGRAGRRDRVARALDLEPGAKRGRGGRRHRLRHGERPDALRPLVAGDVGGFHDRARRGAARTHQDAGARVRQPPRASGRSRGLPDPWPDAPRAVPPPWKRIARRSTSGMPSSEGAPWTWLRKPSSLNRSAAEMPDFASRNEASTACVELPMGDTIPIPVTTTRLIPFSVQATPLHPRWRRSPG